MQKRESFSSRLGFLLISAGCAIGLGNVWRFPYITGKYGGAAFVLVYLLFLVIMGLPVMVMEFSVGRASQKSIALSFNALEPKGTKWHIYSWFGIAGNYLLMMFYTTIAGWLVLYFVKMLKGDFVGLDSTGVSNEFSTLMGQPGLMALFMVIVVVLCMLICSRGLQNGVEKVTKVMMLCLLALMVVLGPDLGRVMFNQPDVGEFLIPLAVTMALSCYCSVLGSILNGIGQQKAVAAVSLLGGGLQLLFTMALVPLPGVGMSGYVAGAGAAAVVETVLCLWLAVRRAGLRLALFQWLTAPGLAALLAALNANLLLRVLKDNGLSSLAAGLVCLLFALVLYLAALHAQGVSLPQALSVGRAKK